MFNKSSIITIATESLNHIRGRGFNLKGMIKYKSMITAFEIVISRLIVY